MRFACSFLLLTSCALLPADGTWQIPAPTVLEDGCGLYTQASPAPSTAVMHHDSLGSFTLRLDGGEPVDCDRAGPDFACTSAVTVLPLGVIDLRNVVVLHGTFFDGFHAEGTITGEATCLGDLCASLPQLGFDFPCQTQLAWAATHEGVP